MNLLENHMEELFDFPCDHEHFQVLIISLNDMLVCLDISNVLRSFSLLALHPLPGGAPYVAGIMNFAVQAFRSLILLCVWAYHHRLTP